MNGYSDFVKNIQAYKFEEYAGISSREKMAVYAIYFLKNNNIPTTFDNVCVTCFKFFPDEFKLSSDYPEYPDIAGLNRTLMHLRPSERNLATGKPNTEYLLTEQGLALAKQISDGLNGKAFMSKKNIARHDATKIRLTGEEYRKFINNSTYKNYLEDLKYSDSLIWKIFNVIPFTRNDYLIDLCKKIKEYAKTIDDDNCYNLINKIEDSLKLIAAEKKQNEKGIK